MLWDYIVTNKSNMEFILILNKIEKNLIEPQLIFFQLHGYGQYGIYMVVL